MLMQPKSFPPPGIPDAEFYRVRRDINGQYELVNLAGRVPKNLTRGGATFKEIIEADRTGYEGIAAFKNNDSIEWWEYPSDADSSATRSSPAVPTSTGVGNTAVQDTLPPRKPASPLPQTTSAHPPPVSAGQNAVADDFTDLPELMIQAKRWIVWKLVPNPDPTKKPRKVPHYADGEKRSGPLDGEADVARLATFSVALKALQTEKYAGLGFALGPDGTGNHWQGIDLDDLPSHPELEHIAGILPGYTERSPSGKGMHAIGYGKHFMTLGSNGTGIEAYSSGRFFSVTADGAGLHPPCDLAEFVESQLRPIHSPRAKTEHANERVETVDPKTVRELRSALLFMSADDRDDWIRIGHALKPLGAVGRGLWMEWSTTSDKFDAADSERVWRSFTTTNTGYQAVFAEAQRRGWVNPQSKTAVHDADTAKAFKQPLKSMTEVEVWRPTKASVPEHLKSFPNAELNRHLLWFNGCAEDTVNSISVTSVIHLAEAVTARVARTNMNNYSSLFLLLIAPTGYGKNYGKNAVMRLLYAADVAMHVSGEFHSKGGVYSAMLASPTVIFHLDEFGEKIKLGIKDGSQLSGAFSYIKELYSACGAVMPAPSYSTVTLSKANAAGIRPIKSPCANFYCLTTPGQLWEAIDNASVEGGFLNRFVGVIADSDGVIMNDTPVFEPPAELVIHIQEVRSYLTGTGNLGEQKFTNSDIDPCPIEYSFDTESRQLLDEFKLEIAQAYKVDDFMANMTARWRENAMRMALALHVFSNPTHRQIGVVVTKWCIDYVRFYGGEFAKAVLEHSQPKSEYGRVRRDFLQAFRSRPGGTSPSELGQKTPWKHVKPQLRNEVISDLKEAGLLAEVAKPTRGHRGQQGKLYVALAET